MSLDASLASWLKLTQISGLGNEGLRHLLQAFGSPDAILDASVSSLSQYVKPSVAKAIREDVDGSLFDTTAAWLKDPANRVITLADVEYPQALLNIPDQIGRAHV